MRFSRFLLPAALAGALSGCFASGSKAFNAGQSALNRGDLIAAQRHLQDAVKAEPGNKKYKAELRKLARAYELQAKSHEKNKNWVEASKAWNEAANADPLNQDYQVRSALSGLKAKDLGPDGWFDGVKGVKDKYGKNKIVLRSFEGAKASAYSYNLSLADEYLRGGDGKKAFVHYQRAKEIDPKTPDMRVDNYTKAEALSMAAQAEEKAAQGDALGAYDQYKAAYALMPMPEISRGMKRVKKQASAILGRLEKARDAAEKGRLAQSIKLYDKLLEIEGVPPSVEEEAAAVRNDLLDAEAQRATKAAEKGQLSSAHRTLLAVLPQLDTSDSNKKTLKDGLNQLKKGKASAGWKTIEPTIGGNSPLTPAFKAYAVAVAEKTYKKAKTLSRRKSQRGKALTLLADIAVFETELPQIISLKTELRGGSFLTLLDEAVSAARRGKDLQAASSLKAALQAASAPEAVKGPVEEGIEHLKNSAYVDAEVSFSAAQAAAPRSKLAEKGLLVAQIRREAAEEKAVANLRAQKNQSQAVDILAASKKQGGSNAQLKAGLRILETRLTRATKLSDRELAETIGFAAQLSNLDEGQIAQLEEAADKLEAGQHAEAEAQLKGVKDAALSSQVAKLAHQAASRRALSALEKGAGKAAEGTEAGAKALAALLKKDPNNRSAKASLERLLKKAELAAGDKNDAEAARFLALANIAAPAAPGVKAELEKGNEALKGGDVAGAESSYSQALEMEPESIVAKRAYNLAKQLNAGVLAAAVNQATQGGSTGQAQEALRRTLQANPDSPEARKAYQKLLAEAQKQGDAGNDSQAADLLDTANVVSKPESARKALAEANGLLKSGQHAKALAAYKKVLESGDSKVARTGAQIAEKRQQGSLLSRVEALRTLKDFDDGARAAAQLRKKDPSNAQAKAAIDAVLAHALAKAEANEERTSGKALRAAAIALSEETTSRKAMDLFNRGKYSDAEEAFGKLGTDFGNRAQKVARAANVKNLSGNLDKGGKEAAKSIRDLLRADPNNKAARQAFEALLAKSQAAAKAGNATETAQALEQADIASGAPAALSGSIRVAIGHIENKRYADADKAFQEVSKEAPDSQVIKTGLKAARTLREGGEAAALKGLSNDKDPRKAAETLKLSLVADPKTPVVKKGLGLAQNRAKEAAKAGDDALLAQSIEAAAILAGQSDETVLSLGEATALVAKSDHEKAQQAFATISGGVAKLGKELSKQRQIAILDQAADAAGKKGDLLKQAELVKAILAIDPANRKAKGLDKKLSSKVTASRIETAKTQKKMGKPGVAWLYLHRALALNPKNSAAQKEKAALEKELKDRTQLIMVVEAVKRDSSVSSGLCKGFEAQLQEMTMVEASKKENLGGFVLSPDWTKAVQNKDSRAPSVTGSLQLTIKKCTAGSSSAKWTLDWAVMAPKGGKASASGSFTSEVPANLLPRDDHDAAGKNVRRVLFKRTMEKLLEQLLEGRGGTKQWLLTAAEHGVEKDDPVVAADAYARLKISGQKNVDGDRLKKVEAYLEKRYK